MTQPASRALGASGGGRCVTLRRILSRRSRRPANQGDGHSEGELSRTNRCSIIRFHLARTNFLILHQFMYSLVDGVIFFRNVVCAPSSAERVRIRAAGVGGIADAPPMDRYHNAPRHTSRRPAHSAQSAYGRFVRHVGRGTGSQEAGHAGLARRVHSRCSAESGIPNETDQAPE